VLGPAGDLGGAGGQGAGQQRRGVRHVSLDAFHQPQLAGLRLVQALDGDLAARRRAHHTVEHGLIFEIVRQEQVHFVVFGAADSGQCVHKRDLTHD